MDAASANSAINSADSIDFLGQSTLRPARMDDAQGISSLYNFYVKSSTATFALEEETLEERRAWLLMHEAKNMPVLVLEMNGRVIGFGSVSPYHNRCGYNQTCELSIYVDPVCVSKGLGKLLLDNLVAHCKDKYHVVLALICSENEASIKLFASRGFKPVGELKEVGYKFDRYLSVSILELLCHAQ